MKWLAHCTLIAITVLAGCATHPSVTPIPPTQPPAPPPVATAPRYGAAEGVLARNDRYVIYRPTQNDSLQSVARAFLGDETQGWVIADFNGIDTVAPGYPIVVPLRPVNPRGVFIDGYQTVPILAYHRFGNKDGKMVVTPDAFAAQMNFLANNGYRVIRLTDLVDFLSGNRGLPARAVVITVDDGYASTYEHAFPVLKKHGFPATVFVYTDFVGGKDALSWDQMREMIASGLIDIQSHSKSHESLADVLPGESEASYRKRVDQELKAGRDILQRTLDTRISSFAYPYGDANPVVVDRVRKADYRLAVTVNPGGNPFFAQPLLLQRTMIFGDHDIEAFKARLQTYRKADLQ